MKVTLNSLSTFAVHFGSSGNKGYTLSSNFSLTSLSPRAFHSIRVCICTICVSNVYTEVSQATRIVDSLALTLRRTSLVPSTHSGHFALEFGPYTCRRSLSTSTLICTTFLPLGSNHQHNLPPGSYEYTHQSLGRLCWLNAGVEEVTTIANLSRATILSRKYCSFFVSEVMFHFPITCRKFTCDFQVSQRTETLCAVLNPLLTCISN